MAVVQEEARDALGSAAGSDGRLSQHVLANAVNRGLDGCTDGCVAGGFFEHL